MVFFGIILFEMVLKLMIVGIKEFFKDTLNLLDVFIVIISSVDIGLTNSKVEIKWEYMSKILISSRVLRMFKLAREWIQLQNMLRILYEAVMQLRFLGIFFVLYLVIYTFLGTDLFGY